MLKLTARHADVWNAGGGAGGSLETATAASQQLDEACAAIGRDPAEIRRSVQLPAGDDAAEIVGRVHSYYEAGFSEIVLMLSGGSMSTSADPVRTAEMLADKVLPQLHR
jgi:hypothetical protein